VLLLIADLAGAGDASALFTQMTLNCSPPQLIFPPELPLLDRPQTMDQQAEVVRKIVRTAVGNCDDIEALLAAATTYVAESGLLLLCIGGTTKTASVAAVFYVLAVSVDADGALWALEDGVAEFPVVGKTGRTGCP
jgi:hypothetical protein